MCTLRDFLNLTPELPRINNGIFSVHSIDHNLMKFTSNSVTRIELISSLYEFPSTSTENSGYVLRINHTHCNIQVNMDGLSKIGESIYPSQIVVYRKNTLENIGRKHQLLGLSSNSENDSIYSVFKYV